MQRANTREDFWPRAKFSPATGCFEWQALRNSYGYGLFNYKGKLWIAHRLALQFSGVELKEGLTVDHICRNRLCVNPAHLRQVTSKENTHAPGSLAPAAINVKKTHCPKGHEYTPDNLTKDVKRSCKTCHRDRAREKYRKVYSKNQEWLERTNQLRRARKARKRLAEASGAD